MGYCNLGDMNDGSAIEIIDRMEYLLKWSTRFCSSKINT